MGITYIQIITSIYFNQFNRFQVMYNYTESLVLKDNNKMVLRYHRYIKVAYIASSDVIRVCYDTTMY